MLGLWVQVTSQPCYQKKHGERARRPGERHTAVEGSKLIARQLRRGHALEEGRDPGIVLAPKVVGDCDRLAMRPRVREPQQRDALLDAPRIAHIQERATLGPSLVAPGIVPQSKSSSSFVPSQL